MEGPSREIEAITNTSNHHRASDSSSDSGTQDELDDLDQLETHCKCPCGQMEFSHCINPPPECLALRYASPLGFPEMDVTKGRDEEKARKAMQQHLLAKTESLKESFTDYGMSVYYYAQSVNGVASPLKTILRLRYPEKVPTTDMTDFEAIYTAVTEDVDFLNFEPLERVMKACDRASGNEHTDEHQTVSDAKKRYEDAFRKFAQLRVFSVVNGLRELRPPVQEGVYPKLKIKVEEDFEAFTIHGADVFREKVRKVLHIPKEVLLRLTDVRQGCVEITFEVIGRVDESTFEIDLLKKKALASVGLSMLEYAGKVYYCCCELSTDEESVIEKLYGRDHYVLPHKTPRLATENYNELISLDESKHSADCPSIQDKLKRCPSEDCVYCGAKHYFCSIESHTLVCDNRKGASFDNDKEAATHDQAKENSRKDQPGLKQITEECTQEIVAEPSEPITGCEDGFTFQFNTPEANLSSKALKIEKEFEGNATHIMVGLSFSGPCLICLNKETLTIKQVDGQLLAKWPYRFIREFGCSFEDPELADKQQLSDTGWFTFKSGRRGPYGVAEYSFSLSQSVLTELKEALTQFAGIEFSDSAGSEENSPQLYPRFNNTSTKADGSESEYFSPSHNQAVTGPPLPPRDYLKSSNYRRRKSSPKSELDAGTGVKGQNTIPSEQLKDAPKFPKSVPVSQARPSKDIISKETPYNSKSPDSSDHTSLKFFPQLSPLLPSMSSSYELHQQHHIHSVSEEGETILNVSPTIRGRRSSKDHHSSASNSMPDVDSGYVMFTPGPHPKLGLDSKDQKIGSSAVPPPMTLSLPDYNWFDEEKCILW